MTQEQKARAYDRAFKEAKAIHNFSSNIAEIKRMEQIFPELAESEDEKVRKALIKYFSEGREYLSLIPYNKEECVAWLERQGEQKPFDYENANAPKSQRIVAAEAKEALYGKPVVSEETIRLIIELFISWNGETEAIDIANLSTAVEYINEYINEN